ncbi:MAG: DUF3574 domain-containing protein [Nitrospira sp.]|nr:DUF3574 domain-containing protein [Nitrospira sp.]
MLDGVSTSADDEILFFICSENGDRRTAITMQNRYRTLVKALLLLVSLVGCGAMNASQCGGDGRTAMQELLYFGTETPSGHVTAEEWTRFLSETVTPRFPEGLSTWQASGQWRSASGQIIRESSYVLNLVHRDDPVPNKAVQDIIASYKIRFQQEAVLRVKSTVCKMF